jgi:xanthine dehydrogenase accessory factor
MAINDRGEISGNVSGGCVEGAVVELAERVLRDGNPKLAHFGIADSDAWDVGLPCRGEIDVWLELYTWTVPDAARAGVRAAEVTLLEGLHAGTKLVITLDGAIGSLGSADADAVGVEAACEPHHVRNSVSDSDRSPLTRWMPTALPHVDNFLAGNSDRVARGAGRPERRRLG